MLTLLTLVLAAVGLAGDVYSTEKDMATGRTYETNPAMNWLMHRLGRAVALVSSHLAVMGVLVWLHQWPANLIIAAVFGWVTHHNLNLRALRSQ